MVLIIGGYVVQENDPKAIAWRKRMTAYEKKKREMEGLWDFDESDTEDEEDENTWYSDDDDDDTDDTKIHIKSDRVHRAEMRTKRKREMESDDDDSDIENTWYSDDDDDDMDDEKNKVHILSDRRKKKRVFVYAYSSCKC